MEVLKFQHDQVIARKNDKVAYCYLVQEGCVIQKFGLSEVRLGKNAIIGIMEKDIYMCDYIATEDTVLAGFYCEDSESLKKLLTGQEKLRKLFLKAVVEQRHQLLTLYSDLSGRTRQFHASVENFYDDYKTFCNRYMIEEQYFSAMENFGSVQMQHRAEQWEINNSNSIVEKYLSEYLELMEKDDSMTVGAIMEAAAQMRRFIQGIAEMEYYLSYHQDILVGEAPVDIYKLFLDLIVKMHAKKHDLELVKKETASILKIADRLKLYNPRLIARKEKELETALLEMEKGHVQDAVIQEVDLSTEDCLSRILEYAGYKDDDVDYFYDMVEKYRNLPDKFSSDTKVYNLRKELTINFYDVYYKVFMKAVRDESSLTYILKMFLNFGFMDYSLIGEENAKALYDLSAHLDICHSYHIYTIYDWLKCIYLGKKEPSKNEFDMDYPTYLADMYKNGKITADQVKEYVSDKDRKVSFEIKNMFMTVNKITYGRITTFCPILCKENIISTIEKMLVTAEKLETALNDIRKVDYSVFYREVIFSDTEKGINSDWVMKEVLPDIILMPNAGSKVIMWQETSGAKSHTPGRIMFPIFTASDVNEMMLEAVGTFRWEICRRVQGMRWNDVREKSLTAEYCSYIQFYRKNRDLSPDAREKLKNALGHAKNNYREVFVKDYINWIKYESKGSFRLNKVVREILTMHCPFVKAIRTELKNNPLYQSAIVLFESEHTRKLQRYTALYTKYVKAGGERADELQETVMFYQM